MGEVLDSQFSEWINKGFSRYEALKWYLRGFNLEEAEIWKKHGFELVDACCFKNDEISPVEAKRMILKEVHGSL